ncbi:MAG: hypothetical protein [Bacteriophage sp.]|nr:MAG: hypothetical protein [Bacteriophage sp.]
MRQFLLAGNVAYGTSFPLAAGAIAFTYLDNGNEAIDANGTKITDKFYIKLGRGANGPVVLPAYRNHLTFVKGTYQLATTFSANLTIGDVNAYSDYSIMIVKKGLKFNERNRWTATIHTGLNPTANDVAKKLANQINNNTIGHGIKATVANANITLTAESKGIDYEILGADELVGISVAAITHALPAYGDAAYIIDLANKAAADAGIEYTYRDTYTELYPAYPINPLKQPDSADVGYTIFTLRFAVPREMKTRDEVVYQIVQIAFPTKADVITTVETILKAIATEKKA